MGEQVQIMVGDYYGRPLYYSVMPEAIFDALEIAALRGEEMVSVDKSMFDTMINAYNRKMA